MPDIHTIPVSANGTTAFIQMPFQTAANNFPVVTSRLDVPVDTLPSLTTALLGSLAGDLPKPMSPDDVAELRRLYPPMLANDDPGMREFL